MQSRGARRAGFVRALEFKHRLRACNAFYYAAALDVYHGKSEKVSDDGAMPHKGGKEFVSLRMAGDKLELRAGEARAGTFSASDLSNNDAGRSS